MLEFSAASPAGEDFCSCGFASMQGRGAVGWAAWELLPSLSLGFQGNFWGEILSQCVRVESEPSRVLPTGESWDPVNCFIDIAKACY